MTSSSIENLKDLLVRAKEGDEKAFGQIYDEYFNPLYRYIYMRAGQSREDAEEIAQEVFLKVFNNLDNLKITEVNPLAYFYTTARHLLIDFYRKKGRGEIITPDEIVDNFETTEQSPNNFTEQRELSEMITASLKCLTDEQKELVMLKFANELSNKEISEITGQSEEAIRQMQVRALQKLREYFNNKGIVYE